MQVEKEAVRGRKILAVASAKENGARVIYKPDGTIISEAWGKEPKAAMAVAECTKELPRIPAKHSSYCDESEDVCYPEALKVKGGEPATDPRFKHLTGVAKKAWIEPYRVRRTSNHRGVLFKAKNGHVSFT